MGGLWAGFITRWQQMPRFWQNLLVGFAVALMLPLLRHTEWVKTAQNFAMDTMIQLNASLQRMTAKAQNREQQYEFTFLEIDEQSYQSWKEPYHVPRGKLMRLIRFALEGGARLVILDINLNNPGVDAAADQALLAYLAALPAQDQARLIMLRLIETPVDRHHPPAFPTFRTTLIDSIGPSHINWAHPYFQKDRSDRLVRRWRLFLRGCYNGMPTALPSVQLLTVMLLRGKEVRQALQSQLDASLPADCAGLAGPRPNQPTRTWQDAYGYDLSTTGITERIIYTMPWELGSGQSSPDLITIPAYLITEATRPPSYESVEDRIVMIGASYAASHDLHDTPLGLMPGAMIITNAAKSLLVLGQIRPPGPLIVWPAILALVISMSFIYSVFPKLTGTLIITGLVVVVLMPVSFFLFRFGIWFDFAAPLLGIQIHQFVAEFNKRGRNQ